MLKKDDVIKFTRSREYIFEKFIGQGGTGKTALIKDDILDTYFVCKKYEPANGNDKEDCFRRFIDEIKILYTLYHKNIVRIYNYYLYPKNTTGFIVMEYIDGKNIEDYLAWEIEETFESVFIQLIEGFQYLESNNVIHRDIKADNILVTKDGIVKIIDFGFGKKINVDNDRQASVLLNWPVSERPKEIEEYRYDSKTDVYFLGKMFDKLLKDNGISDFKYQSIINKMTLISDDERIDSFKTIYSLISNNIIDRANFTLDEKNIYLEFADKLYNKISIYTKEKPSFCELSEIVTNLKNLIEGSLLEDFIQDNSKLIGCFINSTYKYSTKKDIEVSCVEAFYKFLISKSVNIQEIIIENIHTRLESISVDYSEDLPF